MNTVRYTGSAVVTLALLLGASVASAQTTAATATYESIDDSPQPGEVAAELGRVVLSANDGPFTIGSIPLTLIADDGGRAQDLTNCQLVNGTGVALNTDNNVPDLEDSGATTFTFDEPLSISSSVDTIITLECDVADDTDEDATFTFVAGVPDETFAPSDDDEDEDATTSATAANDDFIIDLSAAPSVPAGSQNVALATITLSAGDDDAITLTAIPVSTSFDGVSSAQITSCSIQDTQNLGVPLSAVGTLNETTPTLFTFTAPAMVLPNSMARLALVCSVGSAAPVGSSVTFSVDPSTIQATINGSAVTPEDSGTITATVGINGSLGNGNGGGSIVTSTPSDSTTLPGIPNTGIGGDVLATLLILALSLLAAFIGATVTRKIKTNEPQISA